MVTVVTVAAELEAGGLDADALSDGVLVAGKSVVAVADALEDDEADAVAVAVVAVVTVCVRGGTGLKPLSCV